MRQEEDRAAMILVVMVIVVVAAFPVQNAAPFSIAFLSSHFDVPFAMIAGMAVLSRARMRRPAKKQEGENGATTGRHSRTMTARVRMVRPRSSRNRDL